MQMELVGQSLRTLTRWEMNSDPSDQRALRTDFTNYSYNAQT